MTSFESIVLAVVVAWTFSITESCQQTKYFEIISKGRTVKVGSKLYSCKEKE